MHMIFSNSLPGLPGNLEDSANIFDMKLAFSTNAFKRYALEDSIKEIAAIGYEGVELLCDVPHAYPPEFGEKKIQSVKNLLSDNNLQISNLNAFTFYAIGDTYHPSWIEDDEKSREVRVNHTIDCIQMAKKMGARNISTEPGGPVNGTNNHNVSQLRKIIHRWFIQSFKNS